MYRILVCLLGLPFLVAAQPGRINALNFSTFTGSRVAAAHADASSADRSHPEFGQLPFTNLPCTNCYEDLSSRTSFFRRFVSDQGGVRTVFYQYAASSINFQDEDGRFRSIDPRLTPLSGAGRSYAALQQPMPVSIDVDQRKTSLKIRDEEFSFNWNIRLLHRSSSGIETSLGNADWSRVSAGDDGICITDIYPGVDLVISVRQGEVESGFLLKQVLPFTDGELILPGDLRLPANWQLHSVKRDSLSQLSHGSFFITTAQGDAQAQLRPCFAFDENQSVFPLQSAVRNNTLLVSCPVSWLNDPSRVYPVLLDPVVTTQGILPNGPGGVSGTKFSPVCWTNGCDYTLSVPTPANAKLVRVLNSFEYYAVTGACQAQDGGYSVQLAGCIAPSSVTGVFTCASASTNYYCTAVNVDITADVAGCLPPDQCASSLLDFTLHFYRCNNDPDPTCSENCIRATQPWVVTLESRDLEVPFITPDQQVCNGTAVGLQAVAQFGIGPYSYSWSNGATTDTLTVSPVGTTVYTVSVSDDCGTIRTATTSVTVVTNVNPGFTGSPATVCVNEPLVLVANGAGPASAFSWIVPGSNAPAGIISGLSTANLQYSLPGNYSITLRYQSGSCYSDSTIQLTVTAPAPVEALLTVSPVGSICPGDTLDYNVSAVNAGLSPNITFLLNSVVVQSGSGSSFSSSQLQQGDLVQAVVVSSASCVSPDVDTASLFVVVSGAVTPSVTITPDIDPCVGNSVTFSAAPVNGGSAPTYQWSVNGVPVIGASSSSFTITLTSSDSIVGVVMTSSLNCVLIPLATTAFSIGSVSAAAVSIESLNGDTLCDGENVTIVSLPLNGGNNPSYQWYLNGVQLPDTQAVLSITDLQAGDQVQVMMSSDASCITGGAVSSNIISFQVYPPLSMLVFGASPVCEGESVTLSAQAFGGDGGPYLYSWNRMPVIGTSYDFIPAYSQYVVVVAQDGCGSLPVIDSAYVVVKPLPEAGFTFSPVNPSSLNPVVEFTDRSQGAVNVRWYFGDGDSSSVRYPVHTYDKAGNYPVLQVVTAPNGCVDTLLYTLIISEDIALYFPNTFTPNDDDKNERWFPYGVAGIKYTFVILDRWGKAIFEGDQDNAWAGTFMNTTSVVPEGVYNFVVKLDDSRFASQSFSGKVTLVR